MKKYLHPHIQKAKKWVLPSLMITALGSQYYFSSYSNEFLQFDLSSTAPATPTPDEQAKKLQEVINYFAETIKKMINPPAAPAAGSNETSPQATAQGAYDCAVCKTEVFQNNFKYLLEIAATTKTPASPEVAKQADKPVPKDTPEERLAKIKLEKEEREAAREKAKADREAAKEEREAQAEARKEDREAKAEAKREKEKEKDELKKEKKLARNEKFKVESEKLANECGTDLSCFADGFKDLLTSYTGSDKIDASEVSKVFNKYFDKEIKTAFRTPGLKQELVSSFEGLMSDIPNEYKALKNKVMTGVESAYENRAITAKSYFEQALQAQKAKNLPEANAFFSRGLYEREQIIQEAKFVNQSLGSGLYASNDSTSFDYFRSNYLPDMQRIVTGIVPAGAASLGLAGNQIGVRTGRGVGGISANGATVNTSGNLLQQNGVQFGAVSGTANNTTNLNFNTSNNANLNRVPVNNARVQNNANTVRVQKNSRTRQGTATGVRSN